MQIQRNAAIEAHSPYPPILELPEIQPNVTPTLCQVKHCETKHVNKPRGVQQSISMNRYIRARNMIAGMSMSQLRIELRQRTGGLDRTFTYQYHNMLDK